jgi:hypothetical protein
MMYPIGCSTFATGYVTLFLACKLHYAHTQNFNKWVASLRLSGSDELETRPSQVKDLEPTDVGVPKDKLKWRKVTEAYLMVSSLFQKSSDYLNSPMLVWIVFPGVLFILGVLTYLVTPENAKASLGAIAIAVSVVDFCVFFVPLNIIVYANSAVDEVLSTFQRAGWLDFADIGGREAWVSYIKSHPTYWCVYGECSRPRQSVPPPRDAAKSSLDRVSHDL